MKFKLMKVAVLFLALVACAFSAWAARQSGIYAYYVGACAFALIGLGTVALPASTELLVDRESARVRTWWGPAALSVGLLVLAGVLDVRFLGPAT